MSLVGEGILVTPEKAVSLNGKYFVADSSKQSVIVFNKKGCVIRTIRGLQPAIPSCIAVDYSKQLLLVSDSGNSTIKFTTSRVESSVGFKRNMRQSELHSLKIAKIC